MYTWFNDRILTKKKILKKKDAVSLFFRLTHTYTDVSDDGQIPTRFGDGTNKDFWRVSSIICPRIFSKY